MHDKRGMRKAYEKKKKLRKFCERPKHARTPIATKCPSTRHKLEKSFFLFCTRRRSVTGTFFEALEMPAARTTFKENHRLAGRRCTATQKQARLGHLCPRSSARRPGSDARRGEDGTWVVDDDDNGQERRRRLTHGAECRRSRKRVRGRGGGAHNKAAKTLQREKLLQPPSGFSPGTGKRFYSRAECTLSSSAS